MRLTGIGHAGARIDTAAGSVLCDPWTSAAYFGSWFPFPDNADLPWAELGAVDYLYVSHLHRDHFDPALLRRAVSKRATVLLPDFPTDELERALRDCGFRSFVRTTRGEPVEVDGLRLQIHSLVSPTDGPIGDSALSLDDGVHRILNQNDARPTDLTDLTEFGHYDLLLLQFSGAIWYPMVYDFPERAKRSLGTTKRERQFERTLRYIDAIGADYVVPNAGPPCFLDADLRPHNDTRGEPWNIFPDQTVFLDHLRSLGHGEGRLLLPGTVLDLSEPGVPEHHGFSPAERAQIFHDKDAYLDGYARRRAGELAAEHASWPAPEVDLLPAMRALLEPLLAESTRMADGIGGPVRFDFGTEAILVDFAAREVVRDDGRKCRYVFTMAPDLVRRCLADGDIDWVNRLFLSMRFGARRIGPYNEYIYTFFKCLSEERLQYAEGWFAEQGDGGADIVLGDWVVQQRCPHLKADLSRFGRINDGVLTCLMHGWSWRLADGRCLTSAGHPLRCRPVGTSREEWPGDGATGGAAAAGRTEGADGAGGTAADDVAADLAPASNRRA